LVFEKHLDPKNLLEEKGEGCAPKETSKKRIDSLSIDRANHRSSFSSENNNRLTTGLTFKNMMSSPIDERLPDLLCYHSPQNENHSLQPFIDQPIEYMMIRKHLRLERKSRGA